MSRLVRWFGIPLVVNDFRARRVDVVCIKRFVRVVLLTVGGLTTVAGPVGAAQYDGDRLQRNVILSMLLRESPTESRLAARAITRMYPDDVELTDCVAERLYKDAALEKRSKNVDSLAWYAETLGLSKKNRYVEILSKSRELYQDDKIRNEIENALRILGAAKEPQYAPRTIDLEKKREDNEKELAAHREAAHGGYDNIQPNANLTDVFAALGAPDEMTVLNIRIQKWFRQDVLVANYLGSGIVIVRLERTPAPHWVVVELLEELVPVRGNYAGPNVGLAQVSVALRGEAFREFVKTDMRRFRGDKQETYLMAKRFVAYPTPVDRYDADAMAILMRRIANTKEPEMIDVLRKLAKGPGKNKAKSAAEGAVVKYERRLAKSESKESEAEEDDDDADNDSDSAKSASK